MHVRSIMTALAATTLTLTVGTTLVSSPAHAAGGSRTLSGPATGDSDVYLTYVGCADLLANATAPASRINLGPYAAPLGRRSLGLVPTAAGSAAGPYASFDSLAGLDSSVAVAATGGSSGVSWVMAVSRQSPAGTAWRGRAAVSAPAGSWTTVSSSALTYDWALVDLSSGATVDRAGSATPAQFAAEHGDGPGFAVTGFGCDGKAFNLDAVRASGSTFDFEGVSLSTSVAAGRQQVKPDEEVELTGRVTDGSGRLTGDPLVLESRSPGGQWAPVGKPVLASRDGVARVVVPVAETTEFRWHRPESQYADEGWSDVVTVTVDKPQETQPGDQQTQQQDGQQAAARAAAVGDLRAVVTPASGCWSRYARSRPRASARGHSTSFATPDATASLPTRLLDMASPFTEIEVDDRVVKVTNPDRVYFPPTDAAPSGATKLDLVEYYLAVGDGIVNALFERPCMLHRFPKGLAGDKVHQKRLPAGAPEWVETVQLFFPRWKRTADELCVTELASVIWAVQMSTVEFHPWNSRRSDTEKPDEWRIDLDPGPECDWATVQRVAHIAHEVLDELGAVGFPKTSGGSGMHVYVRIPPDHGFQDVRRGALAFAREVERRAGGEVTTAWWRKDRDPSQLFVDYNQNARDHTIAAAYSVRGVPEARVSAPIRWDEVDDCVPDDFTIFTMPQRFAEIGDLHAGIDDKPFDIAPLLEWAARDEDEGAEAPPEPEES